MYASKENARKAQSALQSVRTMPRAVVAKDWEFLSQFLDLVERRLPTEAAYKRDRKRRKEKAKAKA